MAVMISLVIVALAPSCMIIALMTILIVLVLFYLAHYYTLENGVQKLYSLADKLLAPKIQTR